MTPDETLDLVRYRRLVADLYHGVRKARSPEGGHSAWQDARDDLFATHPQSAVPRRGRAQFTPLRYWAYDTSYRTTGTLIDASPLTLDIAHSGTGATRFERFARVQFDLRGVSLELDLYWLDAYGGGLFLPFKDTTNATFTYGGGRYLIDTVKGADLGMDEGGLILDFNFAYHPSCVYDDRWSCPLAPAGNRLSVPVEAGERLSSP